MNFRSCLAGLLIAAAAAHSSAAAAPAFDTVPDDAGGIEVWLSTADSGDGRQPFIQLFGREPLKDLRYTVVKTDDGGSSVFTTGEFSGIRSSEAKSIGGERIALSGRARFETCVSFLNMRTGRNHILVNFFSENVAVAAGGAYSGQAEEYAAPLRLVTDGSMTCEDALDHDFVMGLPHEKRFRAAEGAGSAESVEDGDLREGIFHIMTYAPSGRDFRFDIEIGTHRSLADVEFLVAIEPAGGGQPMRVGSRLGYFSPSYILQPRKMMGIEEHTDKLPARSVRIQACAAYFDVADQLYWKEDWSVETSIEEQLASPEGGDGRYHYPEKIGWERSNTPLAC